MSIKDIPQDSDSTDSLLSELGHVIDEAEMVKYIVRISDKIYQLKMDDASPDKINFLSGQLSLLENRLASLRLIRNQKNNQ